jgi:hypothetical protein
MSVGVTRPLWDYLDRTAMLSLSHEDQAWFEGTGQGKRKPAGRPGPPGLNDRYCQKLAILMKDLSDEELITLQSAAGNESNS